MKSKLLIIPALALLFVTACKKSDNSSGKIYLLSQLTQTSTNSAAITTTFKYDDQNRLIEEYNDRPSKNDSKFTYDGSDRVIQENSSAYYPVSATNPLATTSTTQYIYTYPSATTINAAITYNSGSGSSQTSNQTYTLNDKQQITKLVYNDTYGSISVYTYDNAGNRLTQSDYYNGKTTPDYVFAFNYDQNKGSLSNIKGNAVALALIPWVNNMVKEVITQYNVTPNSVSTYTSTFEFNSDGYPTKEVQVQSLANGSSTSTQTLTYTYIVK